MNRVASRIRRRTSTTGSLFPHIGQWLFYFQTDTHSHVHDFRRVYARAASMTCWWKASRSRGSHTEAICRSRSDCISSQSTQCSNCDPPTASVSRHVVLASADKQNVFKYCTEPSGVTIRSPMWFSSLGFRLPTKRSSRNGPASYTFSTVTGTSNSPTEAVRPNSAHSLAHHFDRST